MLHFKMQVTTRLTKKDGVYKFVKVMHKKSAPFLNKGFLEEKVSLEQHKINLKFIFEH